MRAILLALWLLSGVNVRAAEDVVTVRRVDLERIKADFETAKAQLASKDQALAVVQASLGKAFSVTIPALQKQADADANARHAAEEKADKEQAVITSKNRVIFWLTIPLAILSACAALWLCLKFNVPNLSPPWGIVVTCVAPIAVFGAVMAITRFV